ncbi:hypothetical protein BAR153v2_003490 [Bartonella sp. AR 15-3]
MSSTTKAIYIYESLHMHLVKAVTLAKKSKHYKALIKKQNKS